MSECSKKQQEIRDLASLSPCASTVRPPRPGPSPALGPWATATLLRSEHPNLRSRSVELPALTPTLAHNNIQLSLSILVSPAFNIARRCVQCTLGRVRARGDDAPGPAGRLVFVSAGGRDLSTRRGAGRGILARGDAGPGTRPGAGAAGLIQVGRGIRGQSVCTAIGSQYRLGQAPKRKQTVHEWYG